LENLIFFWLSIYSPTSPMPALHSTGWTGLELPGIVMLCLRNSSFRPHADNISLPLPRIFLEYLS
jgi:hypothetical protein